MTFKDLSDFYVLRLDDETPAGVLAAVHKPQESWCPFQFELGPALPPGTDAAPAQWVGITCNGSGHWHDFMTVVQRLREAGRQVRLLAPDERLNGLGEQGWTLMSPFERGDQRGYFAFLPGLSDLTPLFLGSLETFETVVWRWAPSTGSGAIELMERLATDGVGHDGPDIKPDQVALGCKRRQLAHVLFPPASNAAEGPVRVFARIHIGASVVVALPETFATLDHARAAIQRHRVPGDYVIGLVRKSISPFK